jgi:hypothetical protein
MFILEDSMKRLLVLTAIFLFLACGSAFAAELTSGGVTPTDGLSVYGGPNATAAGTGAESILIGKNSKGVKFSAAYSTTGFAMVTKHNSGTRGFGTAHDSTAIFFQEVGVGDDNLPAPDTVGNENFSSGWTAM